MKSAVMKDFIREIKNSKNRFISIMILSALAVAFLSGLKAISPDMKRTGDEYLDAQNLHDIQVISTLGITEEDVAALDAFVGIEQAVGSYVIDAWAGDAVTKVYAITPGTNDPLLLDGRMPENLFECVVDEAFLADSGKEIGDTIGIVPGEDYEDALRRMNYTIVGTVRSPLYVSVERGSASIGSGSVRAYIYLTEDAFDMESYTAAYLKVEGARELTAFNEEYDDFIEAQIDAMEDFGDARARLRYNEIIDEANEKISDAQKELNEAEAEVAQEIADAEAELADARKKLDDGWYEYYKGKRELNDAYDELMEADMELQKGYFELLDGEEEFAEGKKQYDDGYAQYEEGKKKLDESYATLSAAQKNIDDGRELLAGIEQSQTASKGLDLAIQGNEATIASLTAQRDALDSTAADYQTQYDALTQQITAEQAALAQNTAAKAQADATYASLTQTATEKGVTKDALDAAQSQLDPGWKEYNDGKATLDASKLELDKAKAELDKGRKELNKGWREYLDGKAELEDGWKEYNDGVSEVPKAYSKLKDGEEEYQDGLKELEDAKIEAAEEIADAKEELADARREVADIETGEWYILPRGYNPGYTGFGQDADRMANLASVFPVIFFIVAALVCLTTMTRMVEENRTQIGLMKALGYGRFAISAKYLSYGLLPSLAGSVIGLAIGYTLFPVMIYVSYQIMYQMPDIHLYTYPNITLWSTAAAVACTTLSTLWACLSTLTSTPANLMRPRAPKPGKRVLLERIPFIWKNMSFNWKITTRNLFRYLKRFWMTVIGIGGCTALIIAGFGLRNSLLITMDKQYGELFLYDAQITLANGLLEEEREAIEEAIAQDENISGSVEMYANSVTAESDAYSISAYIEVFEKDSTDGFLTITDAYTGEPLTVPDNGVLINQKLSELLEVQVGDSITIDSDGRHEAEVVGIYENYVSHFIYLTPESYEDIFRETAETNSLLLKLNDNSEEACNAALSKMLSLNGVSSAVRTAETRSIYESRMQRVDFVVVVIILCAAALAVVVLYNLSNINITERIRELATIKVLGFYDAEVSAYVYRENIILTIVGIALGCLLGKYLHAWLILTVEIDLMMFGRETGTMSYVLSALLTALFSAMVNVIAHKKMKGINMVESLKSAE